MPRKPKDGPGDYEGATGETTGRREEIENDVNYARAAEETRTGEAYDEFELEPAQEITTNLDPQLQDVILSLQSGKAVDPAVGRESEDGSVIIVDVIAQLRDPQKEVPGLKIIRTLDDLVTGTVEAPDIEKVRSDPNVITLKGAKRVQPSLRFSVPEIRGAQSDIGAGLPAGTNPVNGSGVIVGIVDYGCDFVHRNFQNPDGTTRILRLWDQSGGETSMSPTGFAYGREFSSANINAALAAANPYQRLQYEPGPGAHGTHVMDIAAGNGRGTGVPGVAPKADIIFVQLDSGDFTPEQSFGNSRHLLEAVDYIFTKADELNKSAVVNLSLGTHGGPHDGSTPVEQWLDRLLEKPGRAIVIAAGNSWQQRSHAQGTVTRTQPVTLRWEKFPEDMTDNELEVWYAGASNLNVTLVLPGGQRLGPVTLGSSTFLTQQGNRVGRVIHRQRDSSNGDNQINILLGASVPAGIWGVELSTVDSSPVNFHSWIERDDDRRDGFGGIIRNQSRFVAGDENAAFTIGSISCGKHTLAVGSYDAKVIARDLSVFTAEGPTRDGKQKPEISAPGHRVIAASSESTNGSIQMSGTSMAAPHVTGLVALLMQAAGRKLTNAEIRDAVIKSVRMNPPANNAWHPRYGNGRVDCLATALTQFARLPAPTSVPVAPEDADSYSNGNHPAISINELLTSLVDNAGKSRIRLRVEIEVEPLAK